MRPEVRPAADGAARRPRVLVACMGNVLRSDDGFGVAVAGELETRRLPAGVRLIEVGIGGMHLVQELLDGYDAVLIVDAVDRGAAPGALFVLEPEIPDPPADTRDRRELLADLHYTVPSRALFLAKALGRLPATVRIVGCQPAEAEKLGMELSPRVRAAVPEAVRTVEGLLKTWCEGGHAGSAAAAAPPAAT